ncbi:MAG: glycoside hydrolase family 172 protein [Planctomycetota bacterium]|jgi:hypothetical protein
MNSILKTQTTLLVILAIGSLLIVISSGCANVSVVNDKSAVRDIKFFLQRMSSIDHLPELENSHTAMSSTWHRDGSTGDPNDFKRIEGNHNILLNVNGPGCIHRIFTGRLGRKDIGNTRIQIFLDRKAKAVFDMPATEFFDYKNGPFPYPLVFHKTYPGTLFPIPFSKHCLVQLVSEAKPPKWGNYWQLTYTIYSLDTAVKSLTFPFDDETRLEVKKTCNAWLEAELPSMELPGVQWDLEKTLELKPKGQPPRNCEQIILDGCGVIRCMGITVRPVPTLQTLQNVRMKMFWDGAATPSVDVPLAYFFGHTGDIHVPEAAFNSFLLRIISRGRDSLSYFPMPFANGARIKLENNSGGNLTLNISLDVERYETLPANWGCFHATWCEKPAASADSPRYGAKRIPSHIVLDQTGRGKYVGVVLYVIWPRNDWWGEGDWMIWTDEKGFPPSYHGTGTEEYFNSGWCHFDRKAVSGFVKMRPGRPTVYSFHLNDAFQFQHNITVAVETTAFGKARRYIENEHPIWGSTAFWYSDKP